MLYLTGQDGEVSFYSTGDTCVDPAQEYVFTGGTSGCSLYMNNNGKIIELSNPKKIMLSKVVFKIIPFASQQQYIDST